MTDVEYMYEVMIAMMPVERRQIKYIFLSLFIVMGCGKSFFIFSE